MGICSNLCNFSLLQFIKSSFFSIAILVLLFHQSQSVSLNLNDHNLSIQKQLQPMVTKQVLIQQLVNHDIQQAHLSAQAAITKAMDMKLAKLQCRHQQLEAFNDHLIEQGTLKSKFQKREMQAQQNVENLQRNREEIQQEMIQHIVSEINHKGLNRRIRRHITMPMQGMRKQIKDTLSFCSHATVSKIYNITSLTQVTDDFLLNIINIMHNTQKVQLMKIGVSKHILDTIFVKCQQQDIESIRIMIQDIVANQETTIGITVLLHSINNADLDDALTQILNPGHALHSKFIKLRFKCNVGRFNLKQKIQDNVLNENINFKMRSIIKGLHFETLSKVSFEVDMVTKLSLVRRIVSFL